MGSLRFGIAKIRRREISPYFVDLSPVRSSPNEFKQTLYVLQKILEIEVGLEKFRRIAAADTNAIPYAAVLAYTLDAPMLFIQSPRKKGRERRISGILYPGDNIVVVDDMVSTGNTAIKAAKTLRSEGALVEDLVVLLDNKRGGREKLRKEDLTLHSFITIHEVADHLSQMSVITNNERKTIYEWTKKERAKEGL